MLAEEFDVGDVWRVGIEIRDATGTLTDPSNLTFTATSPSALVTTYIWQTDTQLVRDGTGRFHVNVPVTEVGTWNAAYAATGALPLYDPRKAVGVPAGTTAQKAVLRDALRRLMQDGRTDDGQVFSMSRLEDLSDQIPAAATPTQTRFAVRFVGVPTVDYVTVSVVPGTLVAYVDGSSTPTVPSTDADANGGFVLPVAPLSSLQVTYAWQYLTDADVDSFIDQARSWLIFANISDVPDGLSPALEQYAAYQASNALSRKCTLANARAGDTEMQFDSLAKAYASQAAAYLKAATGARDDFYVGAGRNSQAAASATSLVLGNYQPPR